MKLKFRYKTEAEIPAEFKGLFKQEGNEWVMEVEGGVESSRLTEFRETSAKVLKQIAKIVGKDKVEDADVDAVAAELVDLRAKKATFEGVSQTKKEEYERLLNERTATMKTEHEAALKKATDELARSRTKLNELMVDKAVVAAAAKFGLRDGADLDLIARARGVWTLDGDKIVASSDGKAMYGVNAEPLGMDEWLEKHVVPKAGHLFNPSKGGGAPGGGGGAGGGGGGLPAGVNPWDPKTRNLTQQGEIFQKDPEQARRLAAVHGVTLGTGTA